MKLLKNRKNIFTKKKKGDIRFSSFFGFFKKDKSKKNSNYHDNDLDYDLVYSLSPKKIPSLRQFKYTKKVLSLKEKFLINFLLILVLGSLIFLGIKFYKKYVKIYPAFGGEYSEGLIGFPKNINPLYDSIRDVDSDISRLIFSSLFKRNKNGEIVNDIVDNYSISENGLEYNIKIKNEIKWHNGEMMSADDIIFTFDSIKNPEYGSPLRSTFSSVSIEKVDDLSFKFILTEPYSSFLELLTFGILPKNLWVNTSPQNAFLNELNVKPIGSGPYKFKSLIKNKAGEIKEFVLIANSNYYDQVPYINKIILKFFNNYNELINALNNNQVDGINYLPYGLESDLISQNSLSFKKLNLPQITSIFLNSKKNSILEDKEIRIALSELINKNEIVNKIFSGNAGSAYGPILPSSLSYNKDINKHDYNYDKVNNYLNESFWQSVEINNEDLSSIKSAIDIENKKKEVEKELGEDPENVEISEKLKKIANDLNSKNENLNKISSLEIKKNIIESFPNLGDEIIGTWRFKKTNDQNKKYIFLTINLTTVDLVDNITVAEFIKSSWEKLGIKTFIKIISPDQIQSEIIKQKNFEALILSQVIGSDQDVYAFWHSSQIGENGLNISEYKNKEVDKLLEEAKISLNQEERVEKYKKFQEILNNDFPVIFLYFPNYTYVQDKKIKGFDYESILNPADRLNNISRWYIKTNKKIEF